MTMTQTRLSKVQLVCRIDPALNQKVRTHAARAGQTLTTFVERPLTQMVAGHLALPKVR
jgi:predicted HicB family RNase H-like nuclease